MTIFAKVNSAFNSINPFFWRKRYEWEKEAADYYHYLYGINRERNEAILKETEMYLEDVLSGKRPLCKHTWDAYKTWYIDSQDQ